MEDKVYVIYLDGEMYKSRSRKTAYLEEKYAKQVISCDAHTIAEDNYYNDKNKELDNYWYQLPKEIKDKYIAEVKKRFEIREFIERK